MRTSVQVLVLIVGILSCHVVRGAAATDAKPNIVLILADDLGVGEVGPYGQKRIRTPNIDALARGGMKFTRAYSPSPVCAPTRCSLLTGLHQGHAEIRGNKEVQPEGQEPMSDAAETVAEVLKGAGYATACVGKWGLGPVGSSGDPNGQGFEFFFGHNCQRVAHNHYADHVWRNGERVELEGNGELVEVGKTYTPDLMMGEALGWMRRNKDRPFFLYFATPLPHVSLQAPEEAVAAYRGAFGEERPFVREKGSYVSNATPRATYAAMVSKVDEYVGRIVGELKALGVEENTVVIFASDNGPTFQVGGADSAFFGSAMGLRGLKEEVYEGGIRVPLIVRWPGRVKEGTESDLLTALYDFPATACEIAGARLMKRTDGVSLVPTLTGEGKQKEHEFLYWEFGQRGGQKAVRKGKWKAVWVGLKGTVAPKAELYDLEKDPGEARDVSGENEAVVKELTRIRDGEHEPSRVKAWEF